DEKSHKEVPRREDWAEYIDLTPDHPVDITRPPATSDPVTFLIVPRTTAAQLKTAQELGEAGIAGRVEQVTRHDLALIQRRPSLGNVFFPPSSMNSATQVCSARVSPVELNEPPL